MKKISWDKNQCQMRTRNNKRSSSTSSYTSTITSLILVAFCVVGLWMLTSDSVITPQTTTKLDEKEKATKSDSFEDNPGDLPSDALTIDDAQRQEEGKSKPEEPSFGESQRAGIRQEAVDHRKNSHDAAENGENHESVEQRDEGGARKNEEKSSVPEDSKVNEDERANIRLKDRHSQKVLKAAAEDGKNDQRAEDGEDESNSKGQQDQLPRTEEFNKPEEMKELAESAETGKNASEPQKQTLEDVENQPGRPMAFTDETKRGQTTKQGSDDQIPKEDTQKDATTNQESQSTSTDAKEESSDPPVSQEAREQPTTALPNSGIRKESKESKETWSTQASESQHEKERHKEKYDTKVEDNANLRSQTWKLCNVTMGADYIPCLDNMDAIKKLKTTKHYQHRERHCPEDPPTCLVQLPKLYSKPIPWPESRDKIWFHNVPHIELAKFKGHQNWVKFTGEFLTFPGGGTQFINGALSYIEFIEKAVPNIAWGRHSRVVLDVGCGVASFGGFLFDKDVLTMSFAPKDEHTAQIQFALERGIPAISAVMGSQRLPFPSKVYDIVHCARCRVPWHAEGGRLLMEANRVLRPGGWFVWSATPVYQKLPEDMKIWEAMKKLTASMCWKLETVQNNKLNKVAAAIFRKPTKNDCYDQREQNNPPLCKNDDDPNAAWYVPIQNCMHRVPANESERGGKWPPRWPKRLRTPPCWLSKSQMGIYGKPAPIDFTTDGEHWKLVVNKTYKTALGISFQDVRNIMDMRAVYGGFAAALQDLKVKAWVMNVVTVNAPDTLPIIYDRGLFGIYHDWCESFSTYPRTYDLLHADHLFSQMKTRCNIVPVMAEVDRIVRPGGKLIVRDESATTGEVETLLKSLHWEVHSTFSKDQEGILSATKTNWRPETFIPAS